MNRSRDQIIANILAASTEPIKKTLIMYKANLSFDQLKVYMEYLERKQFIHKTEEGLWVTTETGRIFLSQYQLVASIMA